MAKKCSCGTISDGSFCATCGLSLAQAESVELFDEALVATTRTATFLGKYFKTLWASLRDLRPLITRKEPERFLDAGRLFVTSSAATMLLLGLLWPDDPLARFEAPARLAWPNQVLNKIPLGFPATLILLLLWQTVVPFLLLRVSRSPVSFRELLRLYGYNQGGPGSILCLLLLAAIPLIPFIEGFDVFLGWMFAASSIWLMSLYVKALAELTKRIWPICLAFFLASSAITGGVVDAIKSQFVASFKVNGGGFSPSLKPGERVLANLLVFRNRLPRRGEIVLVRYSDSLELLSTEVPPSIGRIMGLPGETVAVQQDKVFVNGKPIEDRWNFCVDGAYVLWDFPEKLLGDGEYFILGDNRCDSYDSRQRGPVRAADILGKIYYRYLPLGVAGYLE